MHKDTQRFRHGKANFLFAGMVALVLNSSVQAQAQAASGSATALHLGTFSKAVDYGPYLIARNKHLFEQALLPYNATVTYETFQTLPSINESFAAKKIDIVFEAEAPALVGKAAGIDLKIIALSATVKLGILTHKDAITSVKDLKGKKIAVLAGTSAHYGLLQALKKAGLTKQDVIVMDMTPPDARSAFESNKVDAWAVWPPFVQQEELTGKALSLNGGDAQSVAVTRESFFSQHRDICRALVKVIENEKRWISDHPAQSAEIIAKELGVPLPVVQRAYPTHDWNARLNNAVIDDIQAKADFLKNVGFIRNSVNVKDNLVDSSLEIAGKP